MQTYGLRAWMRILDMVQVVSVTVNTCITVDTHYGHAAVCNDEYTWTHMQWPTVQASWPQEKRMFSFILWWCTCGSFFRSTDNEIH